MLFFYTDESEVQAQEGNAIGLTIYGGLILGDEELQMLTDLVYDLKKRYLIPTNVELKWRFKSVWDEMKRVGYIPQDMTQSNSREAYDSWRSDYDDIKSEILNTLANSEIKIVVAIRPNRLLNTSPEKIIEYSIGAATKKFEKILAREEEYEIIMADELPRRLRTTDFIDYEYILSLCCIGRDRAFRNILSIVPTISSHISPIHQVNDIVLGAIQYYILEFIRKQQDQNRDISKAVEILQTLNHNFYKSNDGVHVINSGILLYPPKVSRLSNTPAGRFLNNLEAQLKNDFDII
jgi:hypothetical protein